VSYVSPGPGKIYDGGGENFGDPGHRKHQGRQVLVQGGRWGGKRRGVIRWFEEEGRGGSGVSRGSLKERDLGACLKDICRNVAGQKGNLKRGEKGAALYGYQKEGHGGNAGKGRGWLSQWDGKFWVDLSVVLKKGRVHAPAGYQRGGEDLGPGLLPDGGKSSSGGEANRQPKKGKPKSSRVWEERGTSKGKCKRLNLGGKKEVRSYLTGWGEVFRRMNPEWPERKRSHIGKSRCIAGSVGKKS